MTTWHHRREHRGLGSDDTHIMLFSSAEYEFGVKFEMETVKEMKDVGTVADLIMEMLARKVIACL